MVSQRHPNRARNGTLETNPAIPIKLAFSIEGMFVWEAAR
jgi:hypothetical protein